MLHNDSCIVRLQPLNSCIIEQATPKGQLEEEYYGAVLYELYTSTTFNYDDVTHKKHV